MKRGRLLVAIASLLVLGCTPQVDSPDFSNPFDPENGAGLPVPDSIVVTVASNLVRPQWGLPAGETTVYGTFGLTDGSESLPVSDSIVLDRHAVIRSVGFDGAGVRQPGDRIHFQLDAGETDGTASDDVPGLFTALPLFDDGTN